MTLEFRIATMREIKLLPNVGVIPLLSVKIPPEILANLARWLIANLIHLAVPHHKENHCGMLSFPFSGFIAIRKLLNQDARQVGIRPMNILPCSDRCVSNCGNLNFHWGRQALTRIRGSNSALKVMRQR